MIKRDGINYAHVYAWIQRHGLIPAHLEIDHLCRVRSCVNPGHLELVSHTENCRRAARTKLSIEDARRVRGLAAAGLSRSKIASQFDVTKGMINHIVAGRAWREM